MQKKETHLVLNTVIFFSPSAVCKIVIVGSLLAVASRILMDFPCNNETCSCKENILAKREPSLDDEDNTLRGDKNDNIFDALAHETEEVTKALINKAKDPCPRLVPLNVPEGHGSPEKNVLVPSPVHTRRDSMDTIPPVPSCLHNRSSDSRRDNLAQRGYCSNEIMDKTLDEEDSSIFDKFEANGYGTTPSTSNMSFPEVPTPPEIRNHIAINDIKGHKVKPQSCKSTKLEKRSQRDSRRKSRKEREPRFNRHPVQNSGRRAKKNRKVGAEQRNCHAPRSERSENEGGSVSSRIRSPVPNSSRLATYAKRAHEGDNEDDSLKEADDSIFERVAKQHEEGSSDYHRQTAGQILTSDYQYDKYPGTNKSRTEKRMTKNMHYGKRDHESMLHDVGPNSRSHIKWLSQLISSTAQVILCVIPFLFIVACMTELGLGGAMLLVRSLGESFLQVFFGFFTFIMLVVSRLWTETRFLVNLIVCDFKDQACLRIDVFCDHTCLWLDSWKDWIDDISHKQEYL